MCISTIGTPPLRKGDGGAHLFPPRVPRNTCLLAMMVRHSRLSDRIHLLLTGWRLFFQLQKPSWGRCRKVDAHPLYLLAVAVEPNHRDRWRAVERVLRWVLESTFLHGYVLVRQEVREVQLHPHLQISLQVLGQGSAPAPNAPLGEGQHCIIREGTHEEVVALPSAVLLPSGVEVTSTELRELARFVMLQPSGL